MHWRDFAVTHPETATAYTIYIMDLMNEIEMALGNEKEAKTYKNFSEKCRKSYQALREKCSRYTLDTDRQARIVRPLYFDLLNEKQKEYAEKDSFQPWTIMAGDWGQDFYRRRLSCMCWKE